MPPGSLCGRVDWVPGSRTVLGKQCGGSVECRSVWALVTNALEGGPLVCVCVCALARLLTASSQLDLESGGECVAEGAEFRAVLRSRPGRCRGLVVQSVPDFKGQPNRVRGLPFAFFRVNHGVSKGLEESLFPVFSPFIGRVLPIRGRCRLTGLLVPGPSGERLGPLSNVWKRSCKMIGRTGGKAATSHRWAIVIDRITG